MNYASIAKSKRLISMVEFEAPRQLERNKLESKIMQAVSKIKPIFTKKTEAQMSDRKNNALKYLLGDAMVMADIARTKYNEAMTRAYRTQGIPEKRKAYRGYLAQVTGLLARLKEIRK